MPLRRGRVFRVKPWRAGTRKTRSRREPWTASKASGGEASVEGCASRGNGNLPLPANRAPERKRRRSAPPPGNISPAPLEVQRGELGGGAAPLPREAAGTREGGFPRAGGRGGRPSRKPLPPRAIPDLGKAPPGDQGESPMRQLEPRGGGENVPERAGHLVPRGLLPGSGAAPSPTRPTAVWSHQVERFRENAREFPAESPPTAAAAPPGVGPEIFPGQERRSSWSSTRRRSHRSESRERRSSRTPQPVPSRGRRRGTRRPAKPARGRNRSRTGIRAPAGGSTGWSARNVPSGMRLPLPGTRSCAPTGKIEARPDLR